MCGGGGERGATEGVEVEVNRSKGPTGSRSPGSTSIAGCLVQFGPSLLLHRPLIFHAWKPSIGYASSTLMVSLDGGYKLGRTV